MLQIKRALLVGVLAALTAAFAAGAASAVTIAPVGPITLNGNTLQTLTVPSTGRTYTCRWVLNGQILKPQVELGLPLTSIGGIQNANVICNQPGVVVQPLVSPLGTLPGPWDIDLTIVLGLPAPTGALVTFLNVRFQLTDPNIGFRCLYTGTLGVLIQNGNPVANLLASNFFATPQPGDTCPAGLPLNKGPGTYTVTPPLFIGP